MKKSRIVSILLLVALSLLLAISAWAAEPDSAATPVERQDVYRVLGLGLCAALSVTLSVIGASYAVARIGSAALGAAVEKPELLIRSLLFVALAEGLAVLGFAVAMILIQKM